MTDTLEANVIDLDKIDWERIQEAALNSRWMPPEYCRNDWMSDVCAFLRDGPDSFEAPMTDTLEQARASEALGGWMSAALDDPAVCDAMKADIQAWFDAGKPAFAGVVTDTLERREAIRLKAREALCHLTAAANGNPEYAKAAGELRDAVSDGLDLALTTSPRVDEGRFDV
jgi:hypothetical protein